MTVFSELRMRPATAGRAGLGRLHHRTAGDGRRPSSSLLLVGANLATPLYPLLQANLGLSPLGITAPSPATSWPW